MDVSKHSLNTDGKGHWSDVAKTVRLDTFDVTWNPANADDDPDQWGELKVYFDTSTWNVYKEGLIYTDPLFLMGLKNLFGSLGITPDIDYSEQGMQSNNFVSLDVGPKFLESWRKYHNV